MCLVERGLFHDADELLLRHLVQRGKKSGAGSATLSQLARTLHELVPRAYSRS